MRDSTASARTPGSEPANATRLPGRRRLPPTDGPGPPPPPLAAISRPPPPPSRRAVRAAPRRGPPRPRRCGDGGGELGVVLGQGAQDQALLVSEPLHQRRRRDPHLSRDGGQGELGGSLAEHHLQRPCEHTFIADPSRPRHLDLVYE